MNDAAQPAGTDRVECPAAREPAVRMFILAAMLVTFGAWCFVDAFVRGKYPYPPDGKLNGVVGFYFNHVGGVVLPLAGLLPLAWGVAMLKRVLVATPEGIGYQGKPNVPWSQVTRLDAGLLAERGILRLEHGAGRRLTLDSWKLQNFKALVAFVEAHVPVAAGGADEPAQAEEGGQV